MKIRQETRQNNGQTDRWTKGKSKFQPSPEWGYKIKAKKILK